MSSGMDMIGLVAEAAEVLGRAGDVRGNLRVLLELLNERLALHHSFVMLADADSLSIAAAAGLSPAAFRRLEAHADRSPLADVIENGEPADITQLEHVEEGIVIHAVPVALGKTKFGLVGAAIEAKDNPAKLDRVRKIHAVVAALIAQSLRVENAVRGERRQLREENIHLKLELKEKYDFSHIIGNSNAIKHVYEQVTQVAKSNATVLLRGESGTGKEMIANAIHYNSLRSKRPFIKINCAALPETLIESELFGHEKGAFTGADRTKKGRFELADGGTLFLDEIGDIPPQTQVKLLRVLQEREFQRVGGTETIKANIRLITATNKNLEEAITRGDFREDLYYRLNVFTIHLPPLRERKSDILLLAEHFLEKYEEEHGKRVRRISTPAIDMLMSYHFPGNVRELENAIERAVLMCDSNVIHGHHLPATLQTAEVTGTVTDLSLESAVAAFERGMIQDALKSTKGNATKAAKALGTTQRILNYKIKKYGIDTMRFRK